MHDVLRCIRNVKCTNIFCTAYTFVYTCMYALSTEKLFFTPPQMDDGEGSGVLFCFAMQPIGRETLILRDNLVGFGFILNGSKHLNGGITAFQIPFSK